MKKAGQVVETYTYVESPAQKLPAWLLQDNADAPPEPAGNPEAYIATAEIERRVAEEAQKSFEAGRARGAEEARAMECREKEERLRRELAGLVESFAVERGRYLRAVENEVVKLALAIAARILRREAAMDPLLLTGAVRVALGQLAASTHVKLHVPAAQRELWEEAMALLPNLPVQPEVLGDDTMRTGDCTVETELGSVDIGVRAQLHEIERGFFDCAPSEPDRTAEQPA